MVLRRIGHSGHRRSRLVAPDGDHAQAPGKGVHGHHRKVFRGCLGPCSFAVRQSLAGTEASVF
jgi:hypothetical protein